MKFLVLFGVTVLFGVVKCLDKADCWRFKSIECTLNLLGRERDDSFCGRHKQEMYCVANPAIECDMSFKSKAEYLKHIWERICEKNTNIHRELDANVECFMKGVSDSKCTKSVANLMNDDKYEDMNDLQKEACRYSVLRSTTNSPLTKCAWFAKCCGWFYTRLPPFFDSSTCGNPVQGFSPGAYFCWFMGFQIPGDDPDEAPNYSIPELDANVECFMKGVSDSKCTKSVANLMNDDKYEDMNDLQKEACRHFEETKECQLQSIIDNCGKSVATLYKTVFGPVTDVERAVCDDVILPSKDNYYTSKRSARAARPGMFGSMGRIFTFNAFL
ncbi:hypothetical protein AVEN_217165-1 [Araneus ventricosus]|uniref:T20D4.11-like domain-containing protein n=1 Tax=Araneus ventricosus TaxID=182803 RepID=A0A4Y2GMD7_ARAVE|nr:hypothetical protein AVEN_217165-1 [Araneus ventricosus]